MSQNRTKLRVLKKELPNLQYHLPLAEYTTFKIGGPAKYFFEAKTKKELIKALQLAKKIKIPFFILGGGSNILISDKGFNGLVIKYGQPLSLYVKRGLEWAVGIPGTIQAAVYGNTGAFGYSMKDVVRQVEVFDFLTEKIKIFKNRDCQFDYRQSIFKKKRNLIILSVELKKRKSNPQKIRQYLIYRKQTQPLDFPSAGSVFKNPSSFKNLSAGYLIEQCGLKGKRIGQAKISEKHANFIINLGQAKAQDVRRLITLVKKRVKEKFKIELEEEINFLGF